MLKRSECFKIWSLLVIINVCEIADVVTSSVPEIWHGSFLMNDHSFDSRVPAVQFQKERYPRFQHTKLFHLRPELKKGALYPLALILRDVRLFAQTSRLLCSFKFSKIFIIACIKLRKLRSWLRMNVRFPSWSKFNKKMQNLRGSSISKSKLWMFFGKKNNEKDGMQIFSDWFDASKRSYAECNNA